MAQFTATLAKEQLVLTVRRQEVELVAPAKLTPCVHLALSDIDDQEALRHHVSGINFYSGGSDVDKDPVKVIREALAEALVSYYPLAGRLREGPGRKLLVDCTAELGILFIEADADITLQQFGLPLQPPFPFLEEFLHDDVPGSNSNVILGSPLLLIQVTRLICGGFVLAYRFNHTMCDGLGFFQFLTAIGELARGLAPSVHPVWERKLLNARDPPRVTCTHHEYDEVVGAPLEDIVHRSFFFGQAEVATLRQMIPPNERGNCTSFDLITACTWRCRTISLRLKPHEDVRVLCPVNARNKYTPPLPNGYYGNAVAFPAALCTSGELCTQPLGYALKLVKKAKEDVTEEYMRSISDLMVLRGRPHVTGIRTLFLSDLRRIESRDIDFGWGKASFGGITKCGMGPIPGLINFCIPCKNGKDEDGAVVLLCLPRSSMMVFEEELKRMLKHAHQSTTTPLLSSL